MTRRHIVILLLTVSSSSAFRLPSLWSLRRSASATSSLAVVTAATGPGDDRYVNDAGIPELPRPEVLRVLNEAITDNAKTEAAVAGMSGREVLQSDSPHQRQPARAWLKPPNKATRREANAEGIFYVSEGCINCGTCRWMAPETFVAHGFKSAVAHQPLLEGAGAATQVEALESRGTTEDTNNAIKSAHLTSPTPLRRAVQAMVTCPSGSIRTSAPLRRLVRTVAEEDFPMAVDAQRLPGVYHLGYHCHDNLGAASYLLVRSVPGGSQQQQGSNYQNIMVGVPRFSRRLADAIERRFGGVAYLVVTSKGLEMGHAQWKACFPDIVRVVHRHDLRPGETLGVVEEVLDGSGPWDLSADDSDEDEDERYEQGDMEEDQVGEAATAIDVRIVHTPGRTFGTLCVWFKPNTAAADREGGLGETEAAVFTGGHLGFDPKRQRLDGFSGMNRAGLRRQAASMRILLGGGGGDGVGGGSAVAAGQLLEAWNWLLPAYGERVRFADDNERYEQIEEAALRFDSGRRSLV